MSDRRPGVRVVTNGDDPALELQNGSRVTLNIQINETEQEALEQPVEYETEVYTDDFSWWHLITDSDDLEVVITPEVSSSVDYDGYEERVDELERGLLRAYCAGFAKAAETHADKNLEVEALMENELVSESHFYYWDGRTLPLRSYLEAQHGLGGGESA